MEINKEYLQKYRNKEITFEELSKLHNMCRPYFSKLFKKQGYKTNKVLNMENLDHNYFDKIDTYEKAYILGYFVADGNLEFRQDTKLKRISFSCTKDDIELLEFVKFNLNSNNNIHISNKTYKVKNTNYVSKHMASFSVTSSNIFDKLTFLSYGCNKTYKELSSPNLNNKLMWKFLLGLFDGDGCISYSIPRKRKHYNYSFSITSNSKRFLNHLYNFLKQNNIKSFIKKDNNSWKLLINSKKDILKIRNEFYKDINFGLERKRVKFMGIPS